MYICMYIKTTKCIENVYMYIKMTKTLAHGVMDTHLRVLSESYLMNTNMTGFGWLSKIFASLCFGQK